MKAFDYDAVVYSDGQTSIVLCVECLPDGIDVNDEGISPIFASDEWDYAPTCDKCNAKHDYMSIISYERE